MRAALAAAAAIAGATAVLVGADTPLPQFVDIARQAGIVFQHTNGASPDKHLVETMGSGALFFDYDGDGWIDAFLVDGGSIADPAADRRARHRLYHNRSNGTFEDVTDRSGIQHREYGMGACAATSTATAGPICTSPTSERTFCIAIAATGTFVDITSSAHVGDARWSASCAFADLDGDGDLDLWVTNYVDADRTRSPYCTEGPQRALLLSSVEVPSAPEHGLPQRRQRGLHRRGAPSLASAGCAATAWASSSSMSTMTAGPMCSSPTTACRTSSFTTTAGCVSRRSVSLPVWPWRATAPRAQAWGSMPPITTAMAASIW
jgi:hypothetical protein